MAAADLYGAALSFLDGDTGDIRSSVNLQQAGLLVAGSVYTSRGNRADVPREAKTAALSVEIVPAPEWPARPVGIGWKEREIVFELRCTSRKKDLRPGKNQLSTLKNLAQVLVNLYDQVSNLTVNTTGATWRRSFCRIARIDATPESGEYARAILELRFVFTEALAAN